VQLTLAKESTFSHAKKRIERHVLCGGTLPFCFLPHHDIDDKFTMMSLEELQIFALFMLHHSIIYASPLDYRSVFLHTMSLEELQIYTLKKQSPGNKKEKKGSSTSYRMTTLFQSGSDRLPHVSQLCRLCRLKDSPTLVHHSISPTLVHHSIHTPTMSVV